MLETLPMRRNVQPQLRPHPFLMKISKPGNQLEGGRRSIDSLSNLIDYLQEKCCPGISIPRGCVQFDRDRTPSTMSRLHRQPPDHLKHNCSHKTRRAVKGSVSFHARKSKGSRPLILKQLMAGQAGKTGINSAICYQIATKLNEWDRRADSWGDQPFMSDAKRRPNAELGRRRHLGVSQRLRRNSVGKLSDGIHNSRVRSAFSPPHCDFGIAEYLTAIATADI
jgi:hypothetical protein